MRILIDIPEEDYNEIKGHENFIRRSRNPWKIAVLDGVVLPKKHGRLIDADILKSKMGDLAGFGILGRCFDDEPTVIEATKDGDTDANRY